MITSGCTASWTDTLTPCPLDKDPAYLTRHRCANEDGKHAGDQRCACGAEAGHDEDVDWDVSQMMEPTAREHLIDHDPYNEGNGTRAVLPCTSEAVLLEAARLIQTYGHATNDVCHRREGQEGYCVGWAIVVAAHRIAPDLQTDLGLWQESRRSMARAWGFPFDWAEHGQSEEASVPANEYAKEHDIDPIPYLENAAAIAAGRALPHPELAPVDAWPRCQQCGKQIWDGEYCSEACLMGLGPKGPKL